MTQPPPDMSVTPDTSDTPDTRDDYTYGIPEDAMAEFNAAIAELIQPAAAQEAPDVYAKSLRKINEALAAEEQTQPPARYVPPLF